MLMAIVQVIAGVLVWLELAVRNAAIYLAVLFFPVALAASIWPNLAGWTSRLGRLLVAVRPPQAGHADRACVRRQRRAGGAVAQRQPRLVGRDDHRGDHDLRARGDGAVGADAVVAADSGIAPRSAPVFAPPPVTPRSDGAGASRARRRPNHAGAPLARAARSAPLRRRDPVRRAAWPRRRVRGARAGRSGRAAPGSWRRRAGRVRRPADLPRWRAPGRRGAQRRSESCRRKRAPNRHGGASSAIGGAGAAGGGRAGGRIDRAALAAQAAAPAQAARRRTGGGSGRSVAAPSPHPSRVDVSRRAANSGVTRRRHPLARRSAEQPKPLAGSAAPATPGPQPRRASADRWRTELMSSESSETTYRFAPHPSGGFMLGLRIPQLVGLIVAGAIALASLSAGGLGALPLAIASLGSSASVVLVPVRGHTLEQWAPLVRFSGPGAPSRASAPQAAQVGHVVALPPRRASTRSRCEPPTAGRPSWRTSSSWSASSRRTTARCSAWPRTDGRHVHGRGARPVPGVRAAVPGGAPAAPGRVRRRARGARARRLAAAAVSWIERTLPGDPDALGGYLLEAKREDASLDDSARRARLLPAAPRAGRPRRRGPRAAVLRADRRAAASGAARGRTPRRRRPRRDGRARRRGRAAHRPARRRRHHPTGVLTRRGLAAAIRDAYDPWGRRQRHRDQDPAPSTARQRTTHRRPPATSTGRTSDRRRAARTTWVAEWPRIDVRAVFLQPLLMRADTTRTVAVCMELVGPARAIRRAERAPTEAATEDSAARPDRAAHQPAPAPARAGRRAPRGRARPGSRERPLRRLRHRQRPGRRDLSARRPRSGRLARRAPGQGRAAAPGADVGPAGRSASRSGCRCAGG